MAWLKCQGAGRPEFSKLAWIGVRGTSPCSAPWGASSSRTARTTWASSATLWCSKTSRALRPKPAWRARATIWMLRIESPPRSKKLSWIPMSARLSTAPQIAHRVCSTLLRAACQPPETMRSGSGSARRSTLPLGVSGRASRTVTVAGTMYSGRRDLAQDFSSAAARSSASSERTTT